jgi:diguanylate cyclase (GGDEF)-like protein/PAS domain S-box-containing protein
MVARMQSMLPAGLGRRPGPPTALEPDGRTMARAMGALVALAAISLLLWLALPHPPAAHDWPIVGLALAGLAVAGVLLGGAGDRLAPWAFAALSGLTTVAISIGVYAAGSPGGGLPFLYLWVAPYAFAFFSLRWAAGVAGLIAVGYAAALTAAEVPLSVALSRWFLLVTTVTIVGLLVRRLVEMRRASDVRFVRGFADSSIGMGLLSADWRWFEVNDALCRILGRPREELLGRSPAEITHPDDLAKSRAIVDRALGSAAERAQTFTKRYLHPDGTTVWARVDSIFVRRDGHESYFFAQVRDITAEQHATEEQARQARQQAAAARLGRFALAEQDLDAVMEEVARVVAETLAVEHTGVLELSPAGDELRLVAGVGWEPGTIRRAVVPAAPEHPVGRALRIGRPVVIEDVETAEVPELAALLRRRGVASGITVQIAGRDGPWGALTAHSRRPRHYAPDEADFMAAVANVVSGAVERHRTEEEVRHAALHDALTGLPNRTLALDRLEGALARRRRDGRDVAVLLLDLDLFKLVNDSYGHGIGDDLLVTLAPRLQDAVRPADTVARLGGDEFLIVCEQLDGAHDAIQVGERVAQAVSQPIVLRSGEHFITASIGIAMADSADCDTEALIRDADAAMYRSKERGRGRFELFDDRVRERVLTRLRTETELRRALERDELRVVFQPVVDLGDGSVVAVEALVRWQHPDRGLLDPIDFVPVAEDSGLIQPLGRWVLETACREGAALQRRFPRPQPLLLCVNTSAHQIADAAFPAEVAAIARRSGLAPGSLALEITESVLMEDAHAPVTVLGQLRDYGLRLMLDDFGTGYSSLGYLKRFPLDVVKVDRSFIAGLGHDEEDSAIVAAVISMAHTLGLTVVAEGVERGEQVDQLRRLGCDRVQGRLLARPLPAPELGQLMAAGALHP